MAEMKMDLSDRIVVSRRKAKKRQADLADQIAVASSTLSRYESGLIEPPIRQLALIASATGNPDLLDLRWMLENTGDEALGGSAWMDEYAGQDTNLAAAA